MSGNESEDFDEQPQHSQTTNGKSGNESDGSIGDGDRSLNTGPSNSSTAPEKKGARTTIKPQQLEVNFFFLKNIFNLFFCFLDYLGSM
jgi:hypothetical protein